MSPKFIETNQLDLIIFLLFKSSLISIFSTDIYIIDQCKCSSFPLRWNQELQLFPKVYTLLRKPTALQHHLNQINWCYHGTELIIWCRVTWNHWNDYKMKQVCSSCSWIDFVIDIQVLRLSPYRLISYTFTHGRIRGVFSDFAGISFSRMVRLRYFADFVDWLIYNISRI